jgi:primosomal protein N''
MKGDFTGVGKVEQDFEMIETTVSQRRELDSERQQKETEEQRIAREVILPMQSSGLALT